LIAWPASSTFLETSYDVVLLPDVPAAKDNGESVNTAPSASARTKQMDMRFIILTPLKILD